MDTGNKNERPHHPRINANILEILTFSWIFKLFKTGQQRDLDVNDVYSTLNEHKSSLLGNELEDIWKKEISNAKNANREPSLTRALIKMFGSKFLLYGLLHSFVEIILKMVQPLLIGGLLSYFNPDVSKSTDLCHAYIYASLLVINMLIVLVIYHAVQIEILHYGMKMRIACCSVVYKKALRLSNTALGKTTVGQIVNLISNDVNRFDTVVVFFNYMWIGPSQTIVVTYFLWQQIGVSSIIGVAILLMMIPLQGWMGKKISEFRSETAVRTDERVRLMSEIISGIQVIKMYTWEKPFAKIVEYARKMEIKQIKSTSYFRAILLSFTAFHTKIALFFSLLSYVLIGNYISAQKIFVISSYFNMLRVTMTTFFPQGIGVIAETMISIKRLQEFLLYEEKNSLVANHSKTNRYKDNYSESKYTNNDNQIARSNNFAVSFSMVTAKWTCGQKENSLENINLKIQNGRLVAIIGPVGSGKSSLIQVILQELPLSKGNVSVRGTVSYASQEPWLFAGSIQQNILFGSQMDNKRYKKVLRVCALNKDLEMFPYGDRTIVGERGVSLSGGQRARINLARAVYKIADIYLLDDPLSSVDTHVAKHLFEKCIKDFLNEKTCILITHQIQYLTNVNQIILMDNAKVLAQGTYIELLASNLDFTKLLRSKTEISAACKSESNNTNIITKNVGQNVSRQESVHSVASSIEDFKFSEVEENPVEASENRTYGSISRSVYKSYLSAGGSTCKILFILFLCVFMQVIASAGDFWLTYWVNLEEHVFHISEDISRLKSENISTNFVWWSISRQTCVIVFTLLTCLSIVISYVRAVTFVSFCMKSSMTLHKLMFNSITRAKMFFFNTNSSGRILNRFSKDMGTIDEMIPSAIMDCIQIGIFLISVVIVISIIDFYLMIPSFIIAMIFYKLRVYYLSTSRSVKRLEGVTRSPVFAHLNASIQGLTTIRAYEADEIVSREFDNHQDLHSSVWYIFISSSRAFGLWLDIVCFIYISVVTFSFLLIDNNTYGGNVGLAITQAIGLAGIFQWGMRQSAELENQMTSVERVLEYTNNPCEGDLESPPGKIPSIEWPTSGKITFEKYFLRYSTDTPFVIKNLNVNIGSMEKIGIVGRTGAGKSSLIAALFRLAINEGKISIDDVEIHELGLHDLRSKLSIIPQEPVLFSGTMRTNLDPFNEHPDHVLWNALDNVELKTVVEELPNGLNSKMSEGGANFSIGQRQLVCLARAIVRNNKILVLDEATANVDPQTDALIQNTIRYKFQTCTVLTIAHRLNTIIDCDKILVMDSGSMVEFDHPYNLLKNKDGIFFKMVIKAGQDTADFLHSAATKSYNKINVRKNDIE